MEYKIEYGSQLEPNTSLVEGDLADIRVLDADGTRELTIYRRAGDDDQEEVAAEVTVGPDGLLAYFVVG